MDNMPPKVPRLCPSQSSMRTGEDLRAAAAAWHFKVVSQKIAVSVYVSWHSAVVILYGRRTVTESGGQDRTVAC
jgi:hypothetical protein